MIYQPIFNPIINNIFNGGFTNYDSIEKIESSLTPYTYIVYGKPTGVAIKVATPPPLPPNDAVISSAFNETHRQTPVSVPVPKTKQNSYSLFWAIFVSVYGEKEYIQINSKYANREIDERQRIAEYMKTPEGQSGFKQINYKISKIKIQEIMAELVQNYGKKENPYLLCLAFSVFYKKTIYVFNDKNNTYMKYKNISAEFSGEEPPIYLLFQGKNKYKILDAVAAGGAADIEKRIAGSFLIENYDKILKGVSTYKLNELKEILAMVEPKEVAEVAETGFGDDTGALNKQKLYDMIRFYIISRGV